MKFSTEGKPMRSLESQATEVAKDISESREPMLMTPEWRDPIAAPARCRLAASPRQACLILRHGNGYCASSNSGLFALSHAFTSIMSAVALPKHSATADA